MDGNLIGWMLNWNIEIKTISLFHAFICFLSVYHKIISVLTWLKLWVRFCSFFLIIDAAFYPQKLSSDIFLELTNTLKIVIGAGVAFVVLGILVIVAILGYRRTKRSKRTSLSFSLPLFSFLFPSIHPSSLFCLFRCLLLASQLLSLPSPVCIHLHLLFF